MSRLFALEQDVRPAKRSEALRGETGVAVARR
jgi:hypothetical protein